MRSPDTAILSKDLKALEQLEHYKTVRTYYCEHNPSITVYVRDNEWLDVAAWVYKNFDHIGGVSFLPYSDHVYFQAPYTPITEEEYDKRLFEMPNIKWDLFQEDEDNVERTRELACVAGYCDI
jgi:ribonucleoside-diphosphate reductase alpha chain